jgi:hypothetical protein
MGQMKMYTREPDGTIAFKPVSEVPDAQFVPMNQQAPVVQPQTNLKLPFLGEWGIFCRYLDSKMILGGKGVVRPNKDYLPTFEDDFHRFAKYMPIGEIKSGFYNFGKGGQEQLFLNLGVGAILYEGLPDNEGKIMIDYYGDQLGLRSFDITPHQIKAEILGDLNDGFKMLTQYIGE